MRQPWEGDRWRQSRSYRTTIHSNRLTLPFHSLLPCPLREHPPPRRSSVHGKVFHSISSPNAGEFLRPLVQKHLHFPFLHQYIVEHRKGAAAQINTPSMRPSLMMQLKHQRDVWRWQSAVASLLFRQNRWRDIPKTYTLIFCGPTFAPTFTISDGSTLQRHFYIS